MSGAGIAINAGLNEYGARRTGAEFQAMGDDVVQATIQEGLASAPSTQSYKLAVQLQQKLDAGADPHQRRNRAAVPGQCAGHRRGGR